MHPCRDDPAACGRCPETWASTSMHLRCWLPPCLPLLPSQRIPTPQLLKTLCPGARRDSGVLPLPGALARRERGAAGGHRRDRRCGHLYLAQGPGPGVWLLCHRWAAICATAALPHVCRSCHSCFDGDEACGGCTRGGAPGGAAGGTRGMLVAARRINCPAEGPLCLSAPAPASSRAPPLASVLWTAVSAVAPAWVPLGFPPIVLQGSTCRRLMWTP